MTTLAEEFHFENSLAELAGGLNLQHARIVRVVAQAQRHGGWFGEGIHSVAHWLTIHLGVSPGHAKQIDAIARRADDFPLLMEAFDQGELHGRLVCAIFVDMDFVEITVHPLDVCDSPPCPFP